MPSTDRHLLCAQQHLSAAEAIRGIPERSWALVSYFYTALHVVHAALPGVPNILISRQHPESHTDRTQGAEGTNWVLYRDPNCNVIYQPYTSLYNASIDVRYKGGVIASDVLRHHRTELRAVARWACGILHLDVQDCSCWLSLI